MSSTFSTNLAIELIGTGDQAGSWGNTTNTNLGTLIEQAISGYVTQAVATGTDTTITIPNGSTGVARNMYLELTGTGGTNTNLIVPANKKLYFVYNNTTGAVTVKVSGQTGVSVAVGEKKILVSNGTDIVEGTTYLQSTGGSITVTTLTATSGTITNLNSTSAQITTLTGTTFGTTATTNLRGLSGNITTLTSTSANITTLSGTTATFTSATVTNLALTSLTLSNLSVSSANITTLTSSSATISTTLALSGGTANGVAYLNGSKVLTTGSGFTFASSVLTIDGGTGVSSKVRFGQSGIVNWDIQNTASTGVLDITNGAGSAFKSESVNASVVGLYVAAAGNVGIGTSSPGDKLTVSAGRIRMDQDYQIVWQNAGTNRARVYGDSGSNIIFETGSSNTEGMRLTSTGLGIGTSSPGTKLDVNGTARIRAGNTLYFQNATADANGTITASGGAGSSDLAINAGGGSVGIGTSSPSEHLQVYGAGNQRLLLQSTAASGVAVSTQYKTASRTWEIGQAPGIGDNSFTIYDATAAAVRALFDTSGNLGIGTTSPTSKLSISGGLDFKSYIAHADNFALYANSTDGTTLAAYTGYPITFRIGNSEKMRLDSSGNVGLGRVTNANYRMIIRGQGTTSATAGLVVENSAGTEYFYLNDAGNLGLGVTPSASTIAQFEGGANLILVGRGNVYASNNATFNSGWKYISTAVAAQYNISNAEHRWYNAPSGTAGTAISFTQAMTLDASGRLLVGTTSAAGNAGLQVKGASSGYGRFDGTSSVLFAGDAGSLISGAAAADSAIRAEGALLFASGGGTERARIDSSGNLLVGTTSIGYTSSNSTYYTPTSAYWINNHATGTASGTRYIGFGIGVNEIGSITQNGTTGVLYNITSDYRLKEFVAPVTNAGERIDALNPVEFDWKSDGSRARGFFAHEFQQVYANSVTGEKDGVDADGNPVYQTMQASTAEVIADLVAEIKSLRQRVAQLEVK